MKQQSSFPALISLFQSLENHLHNQNLDLAYSDSQSILASDPKNFYAIAIERRLKRVIDFLQKSYSSNSNSMEYSIARIIAALEHVCQMAVRHLTNLSSQASIYDINHQLREQALENKHQSLLNRARQHFHVQEYEHALNEAERARIIRPQSAEAETLIQEIKNHIISPVVKNEKQHAKSDADRKIIEKPEAMTEKILSAISFADYYRTNADYTACIRYIHGGLELDPSNEVLLQMKEEVEKTVKARISEKENSFQLA